MKRWASKQSPVTQLRLVALGISLVVILGGAGTIAMIFTALAFGPILPEVIDAIVKYLIIFLSISTGIMVLSAAGQTVSMAISILRNNRSRDAGSAAQAAPWELAATTGRKEAGDAGPVEKSQ